MRKDEKFPIVEIFKSIEGEGIRTGAPTVFVRFGYCNLRCSWCDTKYAEDIHEITHFSKEHIASEILRLHCNNVTFTGGEPLKSGPEFINWFCQAYPDFWVNIETNGSLPIDKSRYPNAMITMDYKCPSSGMTDKMIKNNISKLSPYDALKFVVATDKDLNEVVSVLMEYQPNCVVYLNPVFGQMPLDKLARFVVEHDFLKNIRIGLQIHKIIWSPELRGV